MFNENNERPKRAENDEWVQDTTWLIPPTSHVREVPLTQEMKALTSEKLRVALRPNVFKRVGSAVLKAIRRPKVEHHHHHHYNHREERDVGYLDY